MDTVILKTLHDIGIMLAVVMAGFLAWIFDVVWMLARWRIISNGRIRRMKLRNAKADEGR